MSKGRNPRERREQRARVQEALDRFDLGYVLDEVARRLGARGTGTVTLRIRDGFVVNTTVATDEVNPIRLELERLLSGRSRDPA